MGCFIPSPFLPGEHPPTHARRPHQPSPLRPAQHFAKFFPSVHPRRISVYPQGWFGAQGSHQDRAYLRRGLGARPPPPPSPSPARSRRASATWPQPRRFLYPTGSSGRRIAAVFWMDDGPFRSRGGVFFVVLFVFFFWDTHTHTHARTEGPFQVANKRGARAVRAGSPQ